MILTFSLDVTGSKSKWSPTTDLGSVAAATQGGSMTFVSVVLVWAGCACVIVASLLQYFVMVFSSNSCLCEQYQETYLAFYVGYMIYTKVKPAPFSSSVKAAITLALGERFNTE